MKKIFAMGLLFMSVMTSNAQDNQAQQDWKLVWHDEFNGVGAPDPDKWNFENGFVRNEEYQWYQSQNAYCKDGILFLKMAKSAIPE